MIRRNPAFIENIKRDFAERLEKSGDVVLNRASALIEEPKSGIHHPGNVRPSSAPGEAPANQDGDLLESLQRSQAVVSEQTIEVHVFSRLTRARMLEAGTATKAPRPVFRPALMQSKTAILQTMKGGTDG